MQFFDWLYQPLFYFFDPSKRLYLGYLFTSFALAFVVLFLQQRNFKKTWKGIFNKQLWFHKSSQVDMELMFVNSIIRGLFFLVVVVSSIAVARWVSGALYDIFPDQQPMGLSYNTTILLYALGSFVLLDFTRFLQHFLFHKVSFLWQFHKVHHSAEVLTPITLYRTHPVESMVSSLRRVLVIGLFSGVFIFYSQSLITGYAILGVNAFDFFFNLFGSNLRHSHIWLSFGPLNHVFISPAQHQIHHSRNSKHFDKNLGFALSVWDKLFGTFYQVKSKEFLIFGLRGERHRSLIQALKAPFH